MVHIFKYILRIQVGQPTRNQAQQFGLFSVRGFLGKSRETVMDANNMVPSISPKIELEHCHLITEKKNYWRVIFDWLL